MKNRQTTLSLLLALLLTSPLVSCSAGNEAPPSTDNTQTTMEQTVEETETEPVYTLPDYDCGGGDLMVLTKMEGTESGRWTTHDVYAEELTGEAINDAVYNRNIALQDKYHCVIRQERMKMDAMPSGIAKFILAGDATYDIIMPNITSAAALSKDGNLYELQDRLALTRPWWNAQFTKDTEIGGKNYFVNGDISETFMRATYAIFFNKGIIADNNLENPYRLVEDGRWTMDKAREMGAVFASDVDGNGKRDETVDHFGFFVLSNQVEALYTSSGEKIIRLGEDGSFSFHAGDERSLRVLESIYSLYADKDVVCNGKTVESGETMFSEDRLLFLMGTMNNVVSMREMETDFGILPMPKLDDTQDRYYTCVLENLTVLGIPVSVTDVSASGALIEALARVGYDTVTPVYYEKALGSKYVRDNDSAEMLDLIYDSVWFDFAYLNSVSLDGINHLFNKSLDGSLVSNFEAKKAVFEKKLTELLDGYRALKE